MSAEFSPGLAGVVAAKSAIGLINGQEGILRYRGIRIEDLAENSSFEEVSYLLLFGKLPTADELRSFEAELIENRTVPSGLIEILRQLPENSHPMVALQAGVSALGCFFPQMDVTDREGNRRAALRRLSRLRFLDGLVS